ncbi:MAG: hypothetical protein H0T65_13290, partial [Deltaproteobacteria bacterium]|nr:hypothetical protein [Deltaproteobacteria bacterium]
MKRIGWLIALAACSDGGTQIRMATSSGPPAYGETPFPTDAVREGNRLGEIAGIDKLVVHHVDLVTAHVAALDGFGLRPLVEFPVDGALDPASIPTRTTSTELASLVDVDPDSPERGRVFAMDWRYDAERSVLAGSPASGVVLREGTRYAAFVTTAIRDAGGSALRSIGSIPGGARWATTREALSELDANVAGIAVFTTQHATAPLVAARNAMLTAEPPTLSFADASLIFKGTAQLDQILGVSTRATEGPRAGLERWGNDNPTGIAHDHVGVVGTGTITIARFRGVDTKTDLPDDETFRADAR